METKIYETPNIEVLEVKIEKGFALSNEQQEPSDWEDM
jgi:hypothetical protein